MIRERATPLRVLVVEDSSADAELIIAALSTGGYEPVTEVICDPADLERALGVANPEVVLADHNLGGWFGFDVLDKIEQLGLSVPVILVTASVGDEVAAAYIKRGAADYLLKRNLAALPGAIARALREHTNRLEKERAQRELQAVARRNMAVARLSQLALTTDSLDQLLQTAVEETVGILGVECGAVLRMDADRPQVAASVGWGCPSPSCECDFDPQACFAAFALERRRITVVNLSPADTPHCCLLLERAGAGCAAACMIGTSNTPLGLLLAGTRNGAIFSDEDLTFLETIANVLGAAMEKARVAEALRDSESRYRDLWDHANDILYTHDLQGFVTSVNDTGVNLSGYTRSEILSLRITDFVASEHREMALESLQRKIAGETVSPYQLDLITKSGARVTVEANTRLIMKDGMPVGVQGIARDVTERNQLQAEFQQAQKMEAVGRLAGGVAHDFNNLLMVIKGYGEILMEKARASEQETRALGEILKAADRAAALTRQLLAFSRQQRLQPTNADLNSVLAGMEGMLRRVIREDIEMKIVRGPGLGVVNVDVGQIEQAVMNLAVNARDAMPSGGQLVIETGNIDLEETHKAHGSLMPPGPYVLLTVSDTGCGMDAETQARIFEPFFTTKERGKGTGLGLAMVYGFVKQVGGFIWVYSEPNHGTTFKIYLPRVNALPARVVERPRHPAMGGSETILLVEDEESLREMMADALRGKGYVVLESANGEEAIETARNHNGRIHLLVTDTIMPRMGGPELAQRLAFRLGAQRVLFMSGYSDDLAFNNRLTETRSPFLQKPFEIEAMCRRVRQMLDDTRVQEAAAT